MPLSANTIEVDQVVRDMFPGLSVAFVRCESRPHTEGSKRSSETSVINKLTRSFETLEGLTTHRHGKAYTVFYEKMGLKIKKVSTPLKQAARIYESKTYHGILPVVDSCMALEYSSLLSFQVFDANTIENSLVYCLAEGNESLLTLGREEKKCKAGELILKEASGIVVHSSYYGPNYPKRLSNRSEGALVRIMKVPGIDRSIFDSVVQQAVKDLCGNIQNVLHI